jgi:putative transposase
MIEALGNRRSTTPELVIILHRLELSVILARMLTGISQKCSPSPEMAQILSQWIGCARVIYNAKCDEDTYLRKFAKNYLPIGTYAPIDKEYSRYKGEGTEWLKDCPSQILRNSATIWHKAYRSFLSGVAKGRPRRKSRIEGNYIWLTREVFRLHWEGANCVIEFGTEKNPVGTMRIKWNKKRIPKELPAPIWIRKTTAGWRISFSYEDGNLVSGDDNEAHLNHLSHLTEQELEALITPIDRGVTRPIQTDKEIIDISSRAKAKMAYRAKLIKRYQRKLARQAKGSKSRYGTLCKIGKLKQQDVNAKDDFWHKTTHDLAKNSKVIVMEDLKLQNMTRRPKPKQDPQTGKWLRNGATAKSALNKSMLNLGLYKFENLLSYKMERLNKPLFKVSPYQTSQECAHCGYIHPDNRKNQSDFQCLSCGHTDNADHNAALVIRKRAIDLLLNSGTELVGAKANVLRLRGNRNPSKTPQSTGYGAHDDFSKKKAA